VKGKARKYYGKRAEMQRRVETPTAWLGRVCKRSGVVAELKMGLCA
jgi:hypothetical protein